MSDIESEAVIAQQKRYISALEKRIDGLKQQIELVTTRDDGLIVGPYRIRRYGREDYWIDNDGEGMQVFRINFEKLIDDYYKSEF